MNLIKYRDESSCPKANAQRNLAGRTHYYDADTMRAFKSRILYAEALDNGLIFATVESFADYDGKRLFRPVVFNLLGNTIERPNKNDSFKTKQAAMSAMWDIVNGLDAVELTKAAIAYEMKRVQQQGQSFIDNELGGAS